MPEFSISVIIPVFNTEKYLAEAIESVLSQTLKPSEIIVVDDGSTDGSADIARKFLPAIRLIQQPNSGIASARNTGIKASTGDYLAFLDADDLWNHKKLELQVEFLKNHPETDMVFGNVQQFVSPELPESFQNKIRLIESAMSGIVAGTMILKKETFLQVGLFNEKLQIGEFIDWFSRAKDLGLKYHTLDEVLLKRRIHENNTGIVKKDKMLDYTNVLREAIARKRQNMKLNNLD